MRPSVSSRFLAFWLALLLAFPAPMWAEAKPGVANKISQGLFAALDKALKATLAKANKGKSLRLELKSSFIDENDRIFLNVTGLARLNLTRAPAKLQQKVRDASGATMSTNGSLAVDVMILKVTEPVAGVFDCRFEADLVLLCHPFLGTLARVGVATLGVLTLDLIANRMIEFLQGLDTERLGEALVAGTEDVAKMLAGDAAEGAYERVRAVEEYRELLKADTITPASIGICIGLAILKSAATAGAKFGGLTLGAAIGVSLSPATGGAIGAVIGGAATVFLGRIVVKKLTVDAPLHYRLYRIRAARESGRAEAADALEAIIVMAVESELQRQRFDTLDLLVGALQKRKGAELEPFLPLVKTLQHKLAGEILQKDDWASARKYYQLLGAAGLNPHDQ